MIQDEERDMAVESAADTGHALRDIIRATAALCVGSAKSSDGKRQDAQRSHDAQGYTHHGGVNAERRCGGKPTRLTRERDV